MRLGKVVVVMPVPKVAVVGRPNVGKSSLFNWLVGKRVAIVEPTPGVTRDRVSTLLCLDSNERPTRHSSPRPRFKDVRDLLEEDEELGEPSQPSDAARYVELIDTGGIGIVDRDDLSDHVERQIRIALEEASLVLFVVDVRDGRLPLDEEVADRLRRINRPTILVVNKVDHPGLEDRVAEFDRLGFDERILVSTKENRNRSGLLDLIARSVPLVDDDKPRAAVMKIAVVGRPNTGKSTFINTLAQEERMIVSEVAGTTRDSVDVHFELDGLPFTAIDTAGVRRKAKLRDSLDYFSLHRAQRSIRRSDVTLLFLDPTQGITKLDKQLADYIQQQYKPCIFVINKWDLIVEGPNRAQAPPQETMAVVAAAIEREFRGLAHVPLAFITAKTGKNVKALINHAQALFKKANLQVPTARLNKVLRQILTSNPPPIREGKRPKVYFITQVAVAPPTLVLFVNNPDLFDTSYRRYLSNRFRDLLPFGTVPVKIYLRDRNDPEAAGSSGRVAMPNRDLLDDATPRDQDNENEEAFEGLRLTDQDWEEEGTSAWLESPLGPNND